MKNWKVFVIVAAALIAVIFSHTATSNIFVLQEMG